MKVDTLPPFDQEIANYVEQLASIIRATGEEY